MKHKHLFILFALALLMVGCKDDVTHTGSGILDSADSIIVIADTFEITSSIDSSSAIVSLPDSALLGEIETDYGTLRAEILTQLTCPEGYSYPSNAVIDSISLFFYYTTWTGDGHAPLSINVYEMDGLSLSYAKQYTTDIDVSQYCSRTKSILRNRRIIVASEKRDSVQASDGTYVPMVRMMTDSSSAFFHRFAAIRSFTTQEDFNRQFKGLMIETDFGSSTMLNIKDVAMGVYYHFSYDKAGRDTTVNDMKVFYANSEVRSVNHLQYMDKSQLLNKLVKDSAQYNYIIGPAGIFTRVSLPVKKMQRSMIHNLAESVLASGDTLVKRPYVNLAELRVDVLNVFSGSSSELTRNDWLQPAPYMLLVKETAAERVLGGKEMPSDTCAIVASLTQGTDSAGNAIYYYSYDLASLLTRELRQDSVPEQLQLRMLPVDVTTTTTSSSTTVISSVREAQALSATKIRSAQSGLTLKLVYCGF
ncbi:MAG: DUF4270 family protein [Paludibacteraceae bacterium]|nr:DUF4270 family protein [Paludibacteraceae bacterium]